MTPDEFKDDAEFEAFLHGKGELAELLRAIPQPGPSAELDAAVLASAEAALATGSRAAANDAFIPPAQRTPPSFLSRWRWPLGLVASVVLMIPIFMLQWQGRFAPETEMVAAVPASPSPAAPAAASPAPTQRADKDADFSQLAKSDSAAKQARAMRDEAPRPNARAKAAKPGAAPPAVSDAATAKAEAPAQEPVAIARAPAAEPQAFPQAVAPPPPAVVAHESADRNAAPAAMPGAATGNAAMAAKRAAPATQSDAQSAAGPVPDQPDLWLVRIEKLIKDGTPKQALDEWVKFKRAYPDYPVRKPLAAQIEELKKEPR